MKKGIHPEYDMTTIQCACGNVMETRSTQKGRIQVEICSACHPHYTGKQRFLDTAGRIDRFKKKFGDKVVGTQKAQSRVAPPAPAPVKAKKEEKPAGKKPDAKAKPAEKQD